MNTNDKAIIVSRYQERLLKYGCDIRTMASGTSERQQNRFEVLASLGVLEGCSILDLGCGFGDFYKYLQERRIRVDYTGYDICPDLISIARERFPEACFDVRDIQVNGIPTAFDYTVCSQAFNNRLVQEDNVDTVKEVIKLCFDASQRGVAIDMLSSYVDFKEDHLFYYQPEEMFAFCKSITKRVTLIHDYPLFEFTLYMYKDFKGWRA